MSEQFRLKLVPPKPFDNYPQFEVQGPNDVISKLANEIISKEWVGTGNWGPSNRTPDQIVLDILANDYNERHKASQ